MGVFTRRHPGRTKVQHDARTRPLKPARWEDEGRYFRCWNCGFVCDSQRDSLGGAEDRAGTNTEFAQTTLPDNRWIDYFGTQVPAILRCRGNTVLMKLGPDGVATQPMLSYSPTVEKYCPFCGSPNWRGDYR